jgi:hypothetical protein
MRKRETIDTVEVTVGGRKVFVPRTLTVRELKKTANLPRRPLIGEKDGKRVIYKDADIIKPVPGETYDDLPEYEPGGNEERFALEMFLLEQAFGDVRYDYENRRWVCISNFDLPSGYSKERSELLIELARNYPFTPPTNFFLDRSIRTHNGKGIEHYYPGRLYNKHYEKGWAWFCIHIKSWNVKDDIMKSDNLLTAVDLAYLTLQDMIKRA